MQIHFKGTNYEIAPEISAHARKKLQSVRKILGRHKHNAYAYVDLGKETEAHQNGRIWYADINFEVNGARFYAKATEETLENAVDRAVNELKSELLTARKREQSLVRKGGVAFKSMLQGFSS
ncbi:MAG TPA: HPF/RaiA family ribosome-associated protein [Candidatus Paceibacterota bacterium]|nr:HPF/RaiA family ribosome-associated protein [Candidatus Paceibacterota bacterium]